MACTSAREVCTNTCCCNISQDNPPYLDDLLVAAVFIARMLFYSIQLLAELPHLLLLRIQAVPACGHPAWGWDWGCSRLTAKPWAVHTAFYPLDVLTAAARGERLFVQARPS